MARTARLAEVELPDFGMPTAMPSIPDRTYAARTEALRRRASERGLDLVIVYADREHSANLSYLSGFDPRFEEAVLILGRDGDPLILAGNECVGMARAAPLPMRVELFQDLSLTGQPRESSRQLSEILAEEGVAPGMTVGVIGWKSFASPSTLEVPAYLVDALRALVGPAGQVINASELLISADDGLRTINEVDQLAAFEYAACHTSEGVKRVLFGLRPGLSEQAAVQLLQWNGMPLSCHLMLSSGPRASLGLLSPTDRAIERGDRFTTAFGIWGALNCRAGFVVASADELPSAIADYVERLVAPYFEAVAAWYAAMHVGQSGGILFDLVDRRIGDPFFGVGLNPGHLLHLDEWVNSPIAAGSDLPIRSGMVLQADVIPATGSDYFTTNIEDGLAVADGTLRRGFASAYPEAWARIQARRTFMAEVIGIELHEDVLPFSNIPAYLPPFLLRPDRVMTLTG